ncbi:TetR/AcrR family transcriptional regulator [Actinomadura sp. KC06]|uniref:TetR/AcrR family transcriptional regulator n=1 Tax=Actinomadura sp. KC06 TaxID=2530369 RepID=UPI0014052BA3|nr:TetR/AcrR family transcriptional regulator [Actinomadura sp. KC06]
MRKSDGGENGQAQALLNAAEELFTERGFYGTSVTDITERAGTSVGALYYHFGSKNGVYHALWSRYMDAQSGRTREAVTLLRAAGVMDGRRLFLAGTRAYLTSAWHHSGLVRMVSDGDAPAGFAGVARRFSQEWARQNTKLLQVSDPLADRALSSIVTGSIGGIAREVADCETLEDADALIAKAIEIYGSLLGVRPFPAADAAEPGAEAAGSGAEFAGPGIQFADAPRAAADGDGPHPR